VHRTAASFFAIRSHSTERKPRSPKNVNTGTDGWVQGTKSGTNRPNSEKSSEDSQDIHLSFSHGQHDRSQQNGGRRGGMIRQIVLLIFRGCGFRSENKRRYSFASPGRPRHVTAEIRAPIWLLRRILRTSAAATIGETWMMRRATKIRTGNDQNKAVGGGRRSPRTEGTGAPSDMTDDRHRT
jgi:hypothetical protein